MVQCSLTRHISLVPGTRADYEKLSCYHYRDGGLGPFVAIYSLVFDSRRGRTLAGVIVYTMPSVGLELRNLLFGGFLADLDRSTRLALINGNFRCISRVIIEPRFRGLGLAGRVVSETMAKMNVPVVEALAVMGAVNPFFEKAGMKAYKAKIPARCSRLIEALSAVGIEEKELIDPQLVQQKIDRLRLVEAGFLERQIKEFLQSYGKRRNMPEGIERTGFVLGKLTERPVYYVWLNKNAQLKLSMS